MKVLSCFDGISAGQLALTRSNYQVTSYFSSEVDKKAIQVTQGHFPDTVQLGDIRDYASWNIDWSSIDLVMGGAPCQSWSVAGLGKGEEDKRGELFFVFLEVIKKVLDSNPKATYLIENVRMKSSFESYLTSKVESYLGVHFKYLLNSSLVSAQNRVRYYWTNLEGVEAPTDRGITWSNPGFIASKRGRYLVNNKRQDSKMSTKGLTTQYIEFRYDGKSNCLTTVLKDNVVVGKIYPERVLASELPHRYLTPEEMEVLQTFPEGYTREVNKTARIKLLGNSWTVDMIVHILNYMERKEDADRRQ